MQRHHSPQTLMSNRRKTRRPPLLIAHKNLLSSVSIKTVRRQMGMLSMSPHGGVQIPKIEEIGEDGWVDATLVDQYPSYA